MPLMIEAPHRKSCSETDWWKYGTLTLMVLGLLVVLAGKKERAGVTIILAPILAKSLIWLVAPAKYLRFKDEYGRHFSRRTQVVCIRLMGVWGLIVCAVVLHGLYESCRR